jgi:hypothetical protein
MNKEPESSEDASLPVPPPPPYRERIFPGSAGSARLEKNKTRTERRIEDEKEDDDLEAPESLIASLGSFDDIRIGKALLTLHSLINFIVFPIYLVFVVSKYRFAYGYVNPDAAPTPPGIFVDQRFDFFGVSLFISCNRWINYYFYSWITDSRVYSWWLFTFQRIIATAFFLYDVFYLILLLVYGFSCNSSFFPSNPCNDPNHYCSAFGNNYPSLCPKNSYDPYYDSNLLSPNITFTADFWFSIWFIASDLIILLASPAFRLTMRKFLIVNSAKINSFSSTLSVPSPKAMTSFQYRGSESYSKQGGSYQPNNNKSNYPYSPNNNNNNNDNNNSS